LSRSGENFFCLFATRKDGPAKNIFPAADRVQHCEVAGMRDTLDAYVANQNWEAKVRVIDPEERVESTIKTRAGHSTVVKCATVGPYRPEALRDYNDFKQLYPSVAGTSGSGAGGQRPRSRCGASGSTNLT
jgi:hypothetical protein